MDPRIRAIYYRLENLLAIIPNSDKRYTINQSIVKSYHQAVHELEELTKEKLEHFMVAQSSAESNWGSEEGEKEWLTDAVKAQIASLLGHLKGIYSFEQTTAFSSGDRSKITVINQNTVAVTLNTNLSQLIAASSNEEEKQKLIQLEQELKLPDNNWNNIKNILVWAINFSKELFFQLLPIILKHYGVS